MKKIVTFAAVAAVTAVSAGAAIAKPVDGDRRTAPAVAAAAAPAAPAAPADPSAAAAGRPAAASPSLVELAIAANASGPYQGLFDTLIGLLVQYPDIVETLSAKGQYTVFAPTDPAFDALFAEIAKPGGIEPSDVTPAVVKEILLYHVAKGRRDAAAVTSSTQIRMLNGSFAAVSGATIDGVNIIVTDVFASNGVIHAVDGVLLPPSLG